LGGEKLLSEAFWEGPPGFAEPSRSPEGSLTADRAAVAKFLAFSGCFCPTSNEFDSFSCQDTVGRAVEAFYEGTGGEKRVLRGNYRKGTLAVRAGDSALQVPDDVAGGAVQQEELVLGTFRA